MNRTHFLKVGVVTGALLSSALPGSAVNTFTVVISPPAVDLTSPDFTNVCENPMPACFDKKGFQPGDDAFNSFPLVVRNATDADAPTGGTFVLVAAPEGGGGGGGGGGREVGEGGGPGFVAINFDASEGNGGGQGAHTSNGGTSSGAGGAYHYQQLPAIFNVPSSSPTSGFSPWTQPGIVPFGPIKPPARPSVPVANAGDKPTSPTTAPESETTPKRKHTQHKHEATRDASHAKHTRPADSQTGSDAPATAGFGVTATANQFETSSAPLEQIGVLSALLPSGSGDPVTQSVVLQATPSAVPEPVSIILLGLGLAGLGVSLRKKI